MPNYSGIWTEQAVMQANGAGNWPNAPGAPTIGTATNTGAGGAVSVAFTAPTFAGLPAVITSYTVTSSPGGLTGTGASSPITVSGLTNGTAYTFTVTATNSSGTGPASAASNSVTPSLIVYVEDVYSTYLYTSTGGDITITNGIDLSTKGGLVWIKSRSNAFSHYLTDTVRGAGRVLYSNLVNGQSGPGGGGASSFSTTGYVDGNQNANGVTQVSWTFREQAKFFDVVTYTGDGTAGRTVAHNLGSVPGCIIVKKTSSGDDWAVYHRSLGATQFLLLNDTLSAGTSSNYWNNTSPTSTEFTLGAIGTTNASGSTYVAYLFAHNAGGFGLTGTDNVISCGSFTTNGSGIATVSLGYEPQWVLIKRTNDVDSWYISDNMRGMAVSGNQPNLEPDLSAAETAGGYNAYPNATGFTANVGIASSPFIYIAIRRGPMKVPTDATKVFAPITWTGSGTNSRVITGAGFTPDMFFLNTRNNTNNYWNNYDRLRGVGQALRSYTTSAETSGINYGMSAFGMDGHTLGDSDGGSGGYNQSSILAFALYFQRAPSFFDEVCWTGDGTNPRSLSHNLTVAPTLIITKKRNSTSNWTTGYDFTSTTYKYFFLNDDGAANADTYASTPVYGGNPTVSVFIVGNQGNMNISGDTYVSYLFATCAGVSKCGTFTGNGSSQTINCGFTGGARFVMIKATSTTGDWMVADSARGIVSGSDPYLELNNTNAEVTGEDWLDTDSTGFVVNEVSGSNANTNGVTYIYLAIA